MMQPPTSNLLADRLGGRVADRGGKAVEDLPGLAPYCPSTKRVSQEVEADVIMITPTIRILAVHDAGLVRMKLQTETRQPGADGVQDMLCLELAHAVDYRIICIALEADVGELPTQPLIERIVEEEVGQQGRDRGALWGSPIPCRDGAVSVLQRRFESPLHVEEHP